MLLDLLVLTCLAECSLGYKILAFLPYPVPSHQKAFAPVLHQLAKRGHHVVYLTSIKPQYSHSNLEIRLIKPFTNIFKEEMNLKRLGKAPKFFVPYIMSSTALKLANFFYGDPAAQSIIHGDDSYDAIIMESYFLQEPVSALTHKFRCPAIEISAIGDSAWINELSGAPGNPAFQIDFKSPLTDTMTFFERLYNTYVSWSTVLVSYYHLWKMQSIMDQYFNYTGWETRPPIHRLVSNRSMILINRDEAVATYPYPSAPHVKNIGGMNLPPNKPLPQDLQIFMDEAESGVIYFSFGSNLKTSDVVGVEFREIFLEVFSEIKHKVLMKWESSLPEGLPQNVKTSEWFPQQDVLAHKNCVLFITHGGLFSLTESVFHGVPVLGIPFFGDQFKNLKHAESAGYGISLDVDNITKISVHWALNEVLTNPRYKKEATRRLALMHDKRHTPLENAVYWIEHAIKYPNFLTPASTKLNFFQLHLLDINAFLCVFLVILIIASYKLFTSLVMLLQNTTKKKHKIL